MQDTLHLMRTRRFLPLFATQFLGAFNDNLYKSAMVIMVTYAIYSDETKEATFNAIAGGLFMPAYENLWTPELIAADPNYAIIKDQVSVSDPFIGASWPAQPAAQIDAIRAQGVLEQSMGNVIAGRMTSQEAVTDAHNKIVQIFEEGGIM